MNGYAIVFAVYAALLATAGAGTPGFTPVQPDLFRFPHALSNAFADFDGDGDGDLDLALTDDFPENGHDALFRNDLPESIARRSLQVTVLDREGRATRSGSEVRLYARDGRLLGTRLVPTGADASGSRTSTRATGRAGRWS